MALLLFAAVFSLQIPGVQTFIARKVINGLEEKFDGKASFGHLDFRPFNNLIIYDLVLTDDNPVLNGTSAPVDTILEISSLEASFSLKELRSPNPRSIRKVVVNGCRANLVVEGTGKNNLKRVLRGQGDGEHKPMDTEKEDFLVRKIELKDLEFRMINANESGRPYQGSGFNWKNLNLKADAKAGNLNIGHGYVTVEVTRLDFEERCGYSAHDISGKVKVGQGSTSITDMYLTDRWSDIHVPFFRMEYDEPRAMRNFLEKVRLSIQIADSNLSLKTLSSFAPSLPAKDIEMFISDATAEGTGNDLEIAGLSFNDLNISKTLNGLHGDLKGHIASLTDPSHLLASINLNGGANFKGNYTGLLLNADGSSEKMNFNCNLTSGDGSVTAEGNISDLLNSSGKRQAEARIAAADFDVSCITGKDIIKTVTMNAEGNVQIGAGKPEITIQNITVDRLDIKGYSYSGITGKGFYGNGAFTGTINSDDPNLTLALSAEGKIDNRSRSLSPVNISLDLTESDVNALGLVSKEMPKAKLGLTAQFDDFGNEKMDGTVNFSDIELWNSSEHCKIGYADIYASSADSTDSIILESSFLNGSYKGGKTITALFHDIKDNYTKGTWNGSDCHLDLTFKKTQDLLSIFVPGAYIEEGSGIDLDIDSNGALKGKLHSGRLALKEKYLKGLDLDIDRTGEKLALNMYGEEANVGAFLLKNNVLLAKADSGNISLGYKFDNNNEEPTRGELALAGELARDDAGKFIANATTLASSIIHRGNEWTIYPASLMYSSGKFCVDSLIVASSDASITVNGAVSDADAESIDIALKEVDLGPLSAIISKDLMLRGKANGKASISSPVKTNLVISADLSLDGLALSGSEIGKADISFAWDKPGKNLDAQISNIKDNRQALLADINYSTETGSALASISMDDFQIGFAEVFLTGIVEDLSGGLDGNIRIEGPLDNLKISSENTVIKNTSLKVSYTNVSYVLDGPFHLTDSCLVFDNAKIKDSGRGTGTVTGGVSYKGLKDFRLDTHISLDRMKAIDLPVDNGQGFYGNLAASGIVNFSGPFDHILLDVDVDTYGNGQFYIPLNGSANISNASLLSFVEDKESSYEDPYESMMAKIIERKSSKVDKGLSMNLRADVNPEVETRLELGGTDGNGLTGRGNGTVIVGVRPNQNLQLDGDYNITGGNFHFSAMGIANKDFDIQDGSSVKFVGDIMDSELDIKAVYKIKTSLSTLIADTSSVSTRRTVNCGINITDKISNPKFSFSVDVQDLDPTTKSMVESALSTEDKIQKQFLSLLVTNSFLPDEGTGIVNNTNLLYSNVAEIMAGQLSNMLQKLDIPLDLGLNYQASEGGTNIFDVAISTQLFNNRVVVNGNIGNKLYNTSNANDVVGDLDIEVKLDKTGALRLNLFSHSADQYSNYLDQSQRNGVGIAYQKEFNFLKELFCKKKRTSPTTKEEKKIIIIDGDE